MDEPRPRVYLDRIEDDVAVLLLEHPAVGQFRLPARFLPPDAREGQMLTLTLTVDTARTEEVWAEAHRMFDEVLRNSPKEDD
jgi:Protein of unknown function (DUF3006)